MKNLIVGNTAQLSNFLDNESFVKISSRNISNTIFKSKWNEVYLFFAEQRTSLSENAEYKDLFYKINFDYTLEIISKLKCNKVIFLSTTELWNLCNGEISINTPWNYKENYYTDSKMLITKRLLNDEKVKIFFPFNFNSVYREKSFLFGKIFDSIKNKKIISVGDLDINRELMHAKFVAEKIFSLENTDIIGTGSLINIKKFIFDLYKSFNLEYNTYVMEDLKSFKKNTNEFFYYKKINYSYQNLLKDYIDDLQNSSG